MILERFYDESLAQASYLVGCPTAGTALVLDPARDVDQYLAAAAARGLRVAAVTETHIHADFVSGSRELAARSGATLYLSDEGAPDWRYAYAAAAGAVPLRDGDEIRVGGLHLRALHTPGHTPEHLSFILTDATASDRPMGVFTGDFVFVGDVGRPDLLERAAGVVGGAEAGARQLFRALQRFKALPDYLQVWPGHGAGSACGRGLSAVPQSTVGFERIASWAFGIDDEADFVRAVLEGQPEAPRYFAEMKRVNREGPPPAAGLPAPALQPDERLGALVAAGALLVDARPAEEFAAGHVPGSLSIPLDGDFVSRAGALLPHDRPLYLLLDDDPGRIDRALRGLRSIGLDRVAGYLGAGAVAGRAAAGGVLARLPAVRPEELADPRRRAAVVLVDVRSPAEWDAGHLPGARHIPLGDLAERLGELPRDRTVVTYCRSGARSAVAASLLLARGLAHVAHLSGGLDACGAAGLRVGTASAAAVPGVAPHPAFSSPRPGSEVARAVGLDRILTRSCARLEPSGPESGGRTT
jgi:hydroxyacylglutathione hydrolase